MESNCTHEQSPYLKPLHPLLLTACLQPEGLAGADDLEAVGHARVLQQVHLHPLHRDALDHLVRVVGGGDGRRVDQDVIELHRGKGGKGRG